MLAAHLKMPRRRRCSEDFVVLKRDFSGLLTALRFCRDLFPFHGLKRLAGGLQGVEMGDPGAY